MRQCLCLHVGQAGIQTGNSIWQLFCLEHGLSADGEIINTNTLQEDSLNTFFNPMENGKYIPRALMLDLEPSVIDLVRKGGQKSIFTHDQLVSGKEDAANNFARGRYTIGKTFAPVALEAIYRHLEKCDSLQGFLIFRSGGGGTGSGFGSLLMDHIANEFSKKSMLEFVIQPAPQLSSAVVEPYNSVFTTHTASVSDYLKCTFMIDNEALYEICNKKLDVGRPHFSTLNQILAQVVSSVTASLRFNGVLNVDLSEFHMNLVPYPRLQYSLMSYAPIISSSQVFHENVTVQTITRSCFNAGNQLAKCDLAQGKFIACCLLYRGDIVPTDINTAINVIKSQKQIKFVEWCPTGFKVGINSQPPTQCPQWDMAKVQRAACMLANSTSLTECWARVGEKFDVMFQKRAFVHWYLSEGMEEDFFIESRHNLEMLMEDYKEVLK